MSRVAALDMRFRACASLQRWGVEIVTVADPVGARLNAITNRFARLELDAGSAYLEDLVTLLKALRWRWMTRPVPAGLSSWLPELSAEAARRALALRGSLGDDRAIEALSNVLEELVAEDPPHGALLLRSLQEAGVGESAVVAVSNAARASLESWLVAVGVAVFTAHDLSRTDSLFEQVYIAGPPRFFAPSLVSSPVTEQVSFVMPSWFGDRSVPCSAIASLAERPIRVAARTTHEGMEDDASVGGLADLDSQHEEDKSLEPQPVWRGFEANQREPRPDEVLARKVLLAGGLAIWLDDGDRIRAIDPAQPEGERVTYLDVPLLRAGDCLLLRRGSTDRRALYEAALELSGALGPEIDRGQRAWKAALADRLEASGERLIIEQLVRLGVRAADRARAWTDPNLIRPLSDADFRLLLEWLGVPRDPTFGNAILLRRMLYQASADIREELEKGVSAADLSPLSRDGYMELALPGGRFRGLIATGVLAISPHAKVVARHDARVLFSEGGAAWLE